MLPVLLSGCANTIVATAEPFCDAARPVCIAADDRITEPTAKQIEGNNLGLVKVCKLKPAEVCPKGMKPAPSVRTAKRATS